MAREGEMCLLTDDAGQADPEVGVLGGLKNRIASDRLHRIASPR